MKIKVVIGIIAIFLLVTTTIASGSILNRLNNLKNLKENVKERIFLTKELEGVVFKPSKYAINIIKTEILSKVSSKNASLLKELENAELLNLEYYILLSKDQRAIVLSKTKIPTGNAKINGWGIGTVDYRGYKWEIFYAKDHHCDTKGIPTTVDAILSNPELYEFRLLNISTHYRAIALSYMYEKANISIPLIVGYISDHEKTKSRFLERIIDFAGKFNRSDKFSRDFIDRILGATDIKRKLPVFRLKQSYWIDSDVYLKGILLNLESAKAYLSLMPEKLQDVSIPSNAKMVVLEVDRIVKGNRATIEDIKVNPNRYIGKQVILDVSGLGVNISANQAIEKALKTAIKLQPELSEFLAPALALAEANPVDVLIQVEILWTPPIPTNKNQIITAIGAIGYAGKPPSRAIQEFRETNKIVRIYGYVVEGRVFKSDHPVIVIQDKKFVRTVSPTEIRDELREAITNVRDKFTKLVLEKIEITNVGKKLPVNYTSIKTAETPKLSPMSQQSVKYEPTYEETPQDSTKIEPHETKQIKPLVSTKTPGFEVLTYAFAMFLAIILIRKIK